jgi:concentrative nucleoside transporter, CNT family
MGRFVGVLGLATMMGLAYIFSTNRRAIKLKTVLWGLGLQFAFAVLVFRLDVGRAVMASLGAKVEILLNYTFAGSSFVFGSLGLSPKNGGVFAFGVLTTIIFVSALFAVLYYLRIMQVVIRVFAWVMTRLMGASGAESLNLAASVFIGQTEAPLTIRPFLSRATRSELMTIMTAGMAHVSGGIMGAYIGFGAEAKNLLSAVIMTAPGALLMAKMLVPETEVAVTASKIVKPGAAVADSVEFDIDDKVEMPKDANILGAIARGTTDGLHLVLNVAAMLIAVLALIAMLNGIMGWVHGYAHWFPASFQAVLGPIFAPIAWLIGIPWKDCVNIGNLLGTRMVINEFIAFHDLGALKTVLDPRSFTIATFALCGFANFSSIGIQIGGIGALAPNKRDELARLGLRAMLAGTMANLMSASIVGILMK